MQFPATLVQLTEKTPPPSKQLNRDKLLVWIYPFHAISSNFGPAGRKGPPQQPNREIFLDWIYPLHTISSNFGSAGRKVNFSKYSHIQKYRTQDHGTGGRPISSLTAIHTNIPAITVTVLDMVL